MGALWAIEEQLRVENGEAALAEGQLSPPFWPLASSAATGREMVERCGRRLMDGDVVAGYLLFGNGVHGEWR